VKLGISVFSLFLIFSHVMENHDQFAIKQLRKTAGLTQYVELAIAINNNNNMNNNCY